MKAYCFILDLLILTKSRKKNQLYCLPGEIKEMKKFLLKLKRNFTLCNIGKKNQRPSMLAVLSTRDLSKSQ